MRTIASIVAVLCIAVLVGLAATPAHVPAYDYGLTGNAWWAAQQRASAQSTRPAAPDRAETGGAPP